MTDLITIDAKKRQVISRDSLTEELERLLSSRGIDWTGKILGKCPTISGGVPVIPKDSTIYCNLLIAIRQFEISLKPAKDEEIITLLARLKIHFIAGYVTAEEFKYLLKDYIIDLRHFPKDLIEMACDHFRTDSDNKYFPKIGQLIKFINKYWYVRKGKLTRLKKLLEVSNQVAEEELKGKTK